MKTEHFPAANQNYAIMPVTDYVEVEILSELQKAALLESLKEAEAGVKEPFNVSEMRELFLKRLNSN